MSDQPDQAALFLDGAGGSRRQIISPEGVPLTVELAEHGERVVAFVIDLFFWLCATALIYLLLGAALVGGLGAPALISVFLFIAFVVRNLYFIYFELAWQGATPGKRICKLRVIDRRGGPLLPVAVVARNLTREMETFMPLGMLNSLRAAGHGAEAWEQLLLGAWLLLVGALPLFNRDRMRGGDFIAGTIVIALPRRSLSGDLVEQTARHSFTDAQLKAYGAFELQILEELLRRPNTLETVRLRRDVSDRICRKIDWPDVVHDTDIAAFLRDFYIAQRAFLEREQLFGKPRADKHHQANQGR